MACNFNIPFSGPASNVVNKIRTEIGKQGGTLDGNDSSGTFNVSVFGSSIKGSYNVSASSLNVVIDSKPMFVSCGQIEGFLKSYIS